MTPGAPTKLLFVVASCTILCTCGRETIANAASDQPFVVPRTANELNELISGQTVHFSFGRESVQVAHYSTDGTVSLWLPEKRDALTGLWRVEEQVSGEVPFVCLQYEERAPFSEFELPSGEWTCLSQDDMRPFVFAILTGDPFSLSSGEVPFVLAEDEWWAPNHLAAASPQLENLNYIFLYDS